MWSRWECYSKLHKKVSVLTVEGEVDAGVCKAAQLSGVRTGGDQDDTGYQ